MRFLFNNLFFLKKKLWLDFVFLTFQRQLMIPNIEQLNRDELLNIYCKFALPLNQRVTPAFKKELSTPVQNGMKFLTISPPSEIQQNSKRMRMTKTEQCDWSSRKRMHEEVNFNIVKSLKIF